MHENSGGKDATNAFDEADHSKKARLNMKEYLIGTLKQLSSKLC